MQRIQEEESHTHTGYTPPPPYTLVDHQHSNTNNNNNNNNNINNNNNNINHSTNQPSQYHSQNPYPAAAIPPEGDYRLAQKLQDEELVHWVETNPQQGGGGSYYQPRSGEASSSMYLPRAPMPPIPEHYQYNHCHSYQSDSAYQNPGQSQHPIIYASPNQPPLPYTQNTYANSGGGQACYGSVNQGYYHSTQSHPFYNAPYHNYQQIHHQEEEDSSCLPGLYDQFLIFAVCVIIALYMLKDYYDFDF